jgi:hypothetical protein
MNTLERAIYYYLKSRRHEFITVREIGRRAGSKRRFRAFPDWAVQVLSNMAERGIVEGDGEGRFRLKPIPPKATAGKRWASPEIAKILEQSGKAFQNVITTVDEDDYYNNL